MRFSEYKYLVKSDLHRIDGRSNTSLLIKAVLFGHETFKYNFWLRTCMYTRHLPLLKFALHPFSRLMLNHYTYKYGISIPYTTKVGCGFYIGHFGNIVVNELSVIGNNCNISQGVTLGIKNRGQYQGCPRIGDNVYIGPGAKIIGAVNVGNNVAIGANCVVTKDVPDNAVVVGIPGKIISFNGSAGYIDNTNYAS